GEDEKTQAILARQILDIVCTIRHNVTQGGERKDAESDGQVIAKALPWLKMIVSGCLNKNQEGV
ncbi:MAG: hypothetical protein JXA89_27050, partial [Anaerolineae bacterium]|nr:hypothetical protein [Anaerolineae bacterium]